MYRQNQFILLICFLVFMTVVKGFSPSLETAGSYSAKKWDVFARGAASGERFKDSKVELGKVAIKNGKKITSTEPSASGDAAAPEEDSKTEDAAPEDAGPAPEDAAPAPEAEDAAPAPEAEDAGPAPEAASAPDSTPPEAPVAANAEEAAKIQELNSEIEAQRKQDELDQKLGAQEAKQKYEECVNNCQMEKEEAESGVKTCCNGDWYRYLCFCYAGTCCA